MTATDRVHGLDALAPSRCYSASSRSALPYVLPPTGSTTGGGRAREMPWSAG